MCCKFFTENFARNLCDFKIANPDFFVRHFVSFFSIEMNNKLTINKLALLLVGKMWLLINLFANLAADVVATVCTETSTVLPCHRDR